MIETFTNDQIISALESLLEYGESEFGKSQAGYFSGGGWAARCLRYHLEQLKRTPQKCRWCGNAGGKQWFGIDGGVLHDGLLFCSVWCLSDSSRSEKMKVATLTPRKEGDPT